MIPEDKDERRMWNQQVKVLADGDRLKMIHVQLTIMHQVTPQEGLRRTYAVMANDVENLLKSR